MPATTVSSIAKVLSSYVRPDFDFLSSLNMVLPRIYGMGYWRDLVYEDVVSTDHPYLSLPDGAESLISATVDDNPVGGRSVWADYRVQGTGSTSGPDPLFGLVDDGYAPTIIDLDPSKSYLIELEPFEEYTFPTSGSVKIKFIDSDGDPDSGTVSLDGTYPVTLNNDSFIISQIKSVTFDEVNSPVEIKALEVGVAPEEAFEFRYDANGDNNFETQTSSFPIADLINGDTTDMVTALNAIPDFGGNLVTISSSTNAEGWVDVTLIFSSALPSGSKLKISAQNTWSSVSVGGSTVMGLTVMKRVETTIARGVGSNVPRYRRFRLSNPTPKTKIVNLLLKRSFTPLTSDDDIIYLGNLNAIKHGLLGMIAEDNADLERAEYHWSICKKLLEEEMDAHRGSVRPTVKFDPFGGAGSPIYNSM